jgi:antitoxin MazE
MGMIDADLYRVIDTLPDDATRRLERGEPVTLVIRKEDGGLKLHEIDPDQAWFWTPEWQQGEREVDAELAAGLGTHYDSDEEFLGHLRQVSENLADS